MPKLSVNLVAFNGEKYLLACLSSVLGQSFKDFCVLMIDNRSTDGTRKELEKASEIFNKKGIEAKTIFLDKNVGFAGGHNIGINESQKLKVKSQEYICCLNQDVILESHFFEKIIEFMDSNQACGAASGKLLRVADGAFEEIPLAPFAKGGKNVIDSAGLRIFKSHRVIDRGQGELDNGQYDEIKEVFGVSGTVPIYRVESLNDVAHSSLAPHCESREYFDSNFFSYKEDIDLAYRLRWRGWKSFIIPEAIAYHKRSAKQENNKKGDIAAIFNRKNKSKFANYYSQCNHIWFLVKNLDKLTFSIFWYESKKFCYELLFEWSTFKAWFDVLKKIGIIREKRRIIMESRKIKATEIGRWFE